MDNECWNQLKVVDGDLSALSEFIATAKRHYTPVPDTYLDFDRILPMPTGYSEDYELWYGWAVENWGSKSNAYGGQLLNDCLTFRTAWSPPIPAIVELARRTGLILRMIYQQPFLDFCGELVAHPDGTFEDDVYSPRSDAPEELKNSLSLLEGD